MKINGITLPLDLDNLTDAANAQAALTACQKKLDELKKAKDHLNGVEDLCTMIATCFDQIFGDGTAPKLFTEPKLSLYVEAFATLTQTIRTQMQAQTEQLQNLYAPYQPERTERNVHSTQK